MYRGEIEHVFAVPGTGLVLMLTKVEGLPREGMDVLVAGKRHQIKAVATNSTDGQPVSNRNCLTLEPTDPYGAIVLDDLNIPRKELPGLWVSEVSAEDV